MEGFGVWFTLKDLNQKQNPIMDMSFCYLSSLATGWVFYSLVSLGKYEIKCNTLISINKFVKRLTMVKSYYTIVFKCIEYLILLIYASSFTITFNNIMLFYSFFFIKINFTNRLLEISQISLYIYLSFVPFPHPPRPTPEGSPKTLKPHVIHEPCKSQHIGLGYAFVTRWKAAKPASCWLLLVLTEAAGIS